MQGGIYFEWLLHNSITTQTALPFSVQFMSCAPVFAPGLKIFHLLQNIYKPWQTTYFPYLFVLFIPHDLCTVLQLPSSTQISFFVSPLLFTAGLSFGSQKFSCIYLLQPLLEEIHATLHFVFSLNHDFPGKSLKKILRFIPHSIITPSTVLCT